MGETLEVELLPKGVTAFRFFQIELSRAVGVHRSVNLGETIEEKNKKRKAGTRN